MFRRLCDFYDRIIFSEIRNADVYYKFTVRRNITVLRGEGATGKTMLYRLVDTFNNVDSRGVSVRVDRGATVETLNRQRFSDGVLLNRAIFWRRPLIYSPQTRKQADKR